MAQRGNPHPTGGKPDKRMRDALMIALNREAVDNEGRPTKKLSLIADKLVDLAIDGDVQAIREINDRIDGRSIQGISVNDGAGMKIVIEGGLPQETDAPPVDDSLANMRG